jgi:hypothetical protein
MPILYTLTTLKLAGKSIGIVVLSEFGGLNPEWEIKPIYRLSPDYIVCRVPMGSLYRVVRIPQDQDLFCGYGYLQYQYEEYLIVII